MTEIKAAARLSFHDGKLDEFKQVSAQILEAVRSKDTGTLQYEIYVSDDQSACVFLERYRDSEALIEHNRNLGVLVEKMLATGSMTAEIFGEPSDELRTMMEGSPVRFFTPFQPT